MYCIKINVSTEKYVCSCDNNSFRLSERKHDATPFDSMDGLLACAKSIGLSEGDFEVVELNTDCSTESDVFVRAKKDVITFERLAEILAEGSVDLWLRPGAKLEKSYIVVAVKPDAVKIWSPKNFLGNMNWQAAMNVAANYVFTWNNEAILPVEAISSELLSEEDIDNLSQNDRTLGFHYWTSTEYSSGYHCIVRYDGDLNFNDDRTSYGCCPGIWVRSRASSVGRSNDEVITFERLHEICEEGSADLILKPGDKLKQGYVVVAVKPDSVKIWSAENFLGEMNWNDAKQAANNYYRVLDNFGLPIIALGSELLSKEEAESISKSDRMAGFYYWTSTESSSGHHWFVDFYGSLGTYGDSNSSGCCPGIWIR